MANNDDDNINNSYLAMLNNPVINPPRQQPPASTEPNTTHVAQSTKPMFPAAQQCQDKLQSYSNDLYLVSETDAPWQNVLVPWSSSTNELPGGRQELEDAGLLVRNTHVDQYNLDDETSFKVESLDVFFDRLLADGNNKDQVDQYVALRDQIKQLLGENVKVYLVGSRVITVLILGIVQDSGDGGKKALVGLQSELVET